ncbi:MULTISPECIES: YncE family protein [Hydrocarboniphaga]|uniref:YncE family protein n=1 Tax=Hydrocarboniphaga TaxID=243627 RepID=UPI0012F8B9ED|nr:MULTISPECIES: hypothetical protein [Hydrocarboniphaga]MDZ4080259.1 hypothetical protein [Hydrocarboniphaga sp.]
MRVWLAPLWVGATLLLGACGGGGGGDSSKVTLTVQDRALYAVGYTDNYSTPPLGTDFSFDSLPEDGIYLGVEQNGSSAVSGTNYSQLSELSGHLDIYLYSPLNRTPGTYTDTVTLRACYDENCRREVQGSPATITVTYEIKAPPPPTTLTLDTTSLTAIGGPGGEAQTLSVLATLDGPDAATLIVKTDFSGTPASSGISSVEVVRVSDTQRRIDVHLADPDTLTPQNYGVSFYVSGCYDASCSRQVQSGYSYVSVSYQVSQFAQQAVQKVASGASDMVWDSVAQKFYLSFPSSAGTYANRIAVLDPATGQITASVVAGSEPKKLAVSGDGAYLYLALGGANQVRRFKLPDLTLDTTLDLGPSPYYGLRFANVLAVAPGQPRTVAVGFSDRGLAIYDDAVRRVDDGGENYYASPTALAWGDDSSVLYANSGSELAVFDVGPSGVLLNRSYYNAFSNYSQSIYYLEGLIYSDAGPVVNPDTGSQVGVFRQTDSSAEVLTVDAPMGRAFMVSRNYSDGYQTRRLTVFDVGSYVPLRTVQFALDDTNARRLLRWGVDGLAVLTDQGNVYLLPSVARP